MPSSWSHVQKRKLLVSRSCPFDFETRDTTPWSKAEKGKKKTHEAVLKLTPLTRKAFGRISGGYNQGIGLDKKNPQKGGRSVEERETGGGASWKTSPP